VNIKKVLLVDDDEYVRRIAAMSLRKLGGFEVQLASSGAEGLVMAERLLPDLILLDIIMPGLDGIVTITELKKSPRARMIPVIFLTGARELTLPAPSIAFLRLSPSPRVKPPSLLAININCS